MALHLRDALHSKGRLCLPMITSMVLVMSPDGKNMDC
jgi:hypothetical protein